MFQKPLIILGIQRQIKLLGELIDAELGASLVPDGEKEFAEKAGQIAANLRRLRKIRRTYAIYLNFSPRVEKDDFADADAAALAS